MDYSTGIDTDINHNIMYPLLLWGEDARNNTHNTTLQSTLATVSALYPDFPRNMRPLSWRRDAGCYCLSKKEWSEPILDLDW